MSIYDLHKQFNRGTLQDYVKQFTIAELINILQLLGIDRIHSKDSTDRLDSIIQILKDEIQGRTR